MAGLTGRCPRCGQGKILSGLMEIAPECPECHLSMSGQDSGDGPAFFVLVIVGALAVGLAAFTEVHYHPPLWLHAALWIPFTLIASILCMRFFKAWLIAIQFKKRPETFT